MLTDGRARQCEKQSRARPCSLMGELVNVNSRVELVHVD